MGKRKTTLVLSSSDDDDDDKTLSFTRSKGKRKTTVVLASSDDDDDDGIMTFSLRSRTTSNSKAKKSRPPPSVPRVNSRTAAKKPRLSDSRAVPVSRKESNGFDEIKLFCEDFDEGFSGFRMSTGFGRSNRKDLWVDKYKPCSLEELAVHKKKVEEVKMWIEKRLKRRKAGTGSMSRSYTSNTSHKLKVQYDNQEELCSNVLVITGQAGVGKSTTVNVIASHLRATVCEWNTPTPTIWQEHLHNSNLGVRYMSKLDEFENFIERTRKYGFITSSFTGGSQASMILVIDDLPVANGRVSYEKLNKCLHLLVQAALVPTVILITDCGEANSSDNSPQNWEELQLSLQRAGACKVAFNPITVNSIKKTLSRICREEHLNVDGEQIDLIAKASGGDIRHAITTLQYFCVKPHLRLSLSPSNGTSSYLKEQSEDMSRLDERFSLPFGRDETLSLFHALGKFLHNKRETENSMSFEQDAFLVKERFARLPMKMDAPEMVLCKAHGQARPVTDFLHENVLDFLSEEAIDDACVVTSYLSDADSLLASLSGMITRNYEAENVIQSAAASVAVRGVLFGNFHPLSSRWHTIRRPSLWQVEQSLRYNKLETVRQRCIAYDGMSLSDLSVVATEFKPALKWLGFRGSEGHESRNVSEKHIMLDDESVDGSSFDDKDDTSDDEIEDW